MGESNREWGALAEWDTELSEIWDAALPLPAPGKNPDLDKFLEDRHLRVNSLIKIGTKILADGVTLVFGSDRGIKYRRLTDGKRWGFPGSEFMVPKVLLRKPERASTVLVVEGETDAARMLDAPYDFDVAMLLGGAGTFNQDSADALADYEQILIGTDNDEAGNAGAKKIQKLLPHAQRWGPPEGCNDWCEVKENWPAVPEPVKAMPIIVNAGDLFELEVPEIASWFDKALLPIGGFAMIHGWAKNYKSWVAMDMLSALAQHMPWAGMDPTNEPARVCAMQFEIPFPYYRERLQFLFEQAVHKDLFKENFTTYSPVVRPHIAAGNKKMEDKLLGDLVKDGTNVFLIDPIRRATGGADLNDEKEVRALLSFIERICDEGITVIAVHHDNKTGAKEGGGGPLSMTGSGAFAGDPDTIISISRPKGVTESQPQRDIDFTVRNGPMILPCGFEMQSDSSLRYTPEPWYATNSEDEGGEPGI